jgi:hypothetical protein
MAEHFASEYVTLDDRRGWNWNDFACQVIPGGGNGFRAGRGVLPGWPGANTRASAGGLRIGSQAKNRLPASLLLPLVRYRSRPIQAPPQASPNANGATAKANNTPSGATKAKMATIDASASVAASAGSSTPMAELARATR